MSSADLRQALVHLLPRLKHAGRRRECEGALRCLDRGDVEQAAFEAYVATLDNPDPSFQRVAVVARTLNPQSCR